MPIEEDRRLEPGAERRIDRHKGSALRHFFRIFRRMAFGNVAPGYLVGDLTDDRLILAADAPIVIDGGPTKKISPCPKPCFSRSATAASASDRVAYKREILCAILPCSCFAGGGTSAVCSFVGLLTHRPAPVE